MPDATNPALVLESNASLRFHADRPVPQPRAPGSILVRVAACGICGSDLPRAFDNGAYHTPLVLGHEFSGVVQEDGRRWRKGDRVAVFPLIPRPGQPAFSTGDYAQTTNYDYFGSRCDGGMQALLPIPEDNLHAVRDDVPLLHAACTEPAAVALHAVRKLRILAGDAAAVFGGGFIGNLAAQWLRIHGCSRVFVVDVDGAKLDLAGSMGFSPVDARQGDPVAAIRDATAGAGVPRVIEACGLPVTYLQSLQAAATFGEVVLLGNLHGELRIGEKDVSSILRRELTILGTWNSKVVPQGSDDWSTVLRFLDRELVVAPLLTGLPLLSEAAAAFDDLHLRRVAHHKVVIRVSPELCS